MDINFDDTGCPKCKGKMHNINVVTGGHADAVTKKCNDDNCGQLVMFIVPPVGRNISVEIGPAVKTVKG